MWIRAFSHQSLTLAYTEPMLFIDDYEAEISEPSPISDERVRPDDDVEQTLLHPKPRLTPFAEARRAGDTRNANAKGCKRCDKAPLMLLRQDVGRRHERNLTPRAHRHQACSRGNGCLSGSDFAL
jgi:hypothetical protein